MSLKVIGAGFGRTGTMSLKLALEQLGFNKCYHMFEVMEHPEHIPVWASAHQGKDINWQALFEGYLASVDWPSCNLWREQMARYPDAKVILSTRDPERWYASVMNTIYPSSSGLRDSEDENMARFGHWTCEIIWGRVFDDRMDDKDHCIRVFKAHEKSVIDTVPRDKLLVFQADQGWEPLCRFLGCDVPDEDYPHTNTTQEFLAHREQ
ncbi:MAG: sulfotransferase family protein [Gammaproteobacteria bacterium]|nr:sulfotransferase family protein [Gammaproteobacteria bacterium]